MTARKDLHRDESPSSMSESSTSSSSSSSIGSSAVIVNKTGTSSLSSCSSPVMLEGPNTHQQLEQPQLHEVTNEFSKKGKGKSFIFMKFPHLSSYQSPLWFLIPFFHRLSRFPNSFTTREWIQEGRTTRRRRNHGQFIDTDNPSVKFELLLP